MPSYGQQSTFERLGGTDLRGVMQNWMVAHVRQCNPTLPVDHRMLGSTMSMRIILPSLSFTACVTHCLLCRYSSPSSSCRVYLRASSSLKRPKR